MWDQCSALLRLSARSAVASISPCRTDQHQHDQRRQDKARDQRKHRMKWMAVEVAAIVRPEMEQGSHTSLLACDILDTLSRRVCSDGRPIQFTPKMHT